MTDIKEAIKRLVNMMEDDFISVKQCHGKVNDAYNRGALDVISSLHDSHEYQALKASLDAPVAKVEVTDSMIVIGLNKFFGGLEDWPSTYKNIMRAALEAVFNHIGDSNKKVEPANSIFNSFPPEAPLLDEPELSTQEETDFKTIALRHEREEKQEELKRKLCDCEPLRTGRPGEVWTCCHICQGGTWINLNKSGLLCAGVPVLNGQSLSVIAELQKKQTLLDFAVLYTDLDTFTPSEIIEIISEYLEQRK